MILNRPRGINNVVIGKKDKATKQVDQNPSFF